MIHMHFILTADNDLVVFRPIDPSSVLVAGAERSMGSKWKDGTYSVDESRRLWALIGDGGGNVPSPESQKAISEGIGRFYQEQIDRIADKHRDMILVEVGHMKDIKELEATVSSQGKTIDTLRKSLDIKNKAIADHDLKVQQIFYDMEKNEERELRDLMTRSSMEILFADQAKFCDYEK